MEKCAIAARVGCVGIGLFVFIWLVYPGGTKPPPGREWLLIPGRPLATSEYYLDQVRFYWDTRQRNEIKFLQRIKRISVFENSREVDIVDRFWFSNKIRVQLKDAKDGLWYYCFADDVVDRPISSN